MVQASMHFPILVANQYANLVNAMQACHEALQHYADATYPYGTAVVSGTVAPAVVDAYLAPGTRDPGSYTYLMTSPDTVTTYVALPPSGLQVAVTQLQKLANYGIIAGPVIAGQIVPHLPTQPTTAAAGVPNGAIAIQTVLRGH
jgi:hypothetical protein